VEEAEMSSDVAQLEQAWLQAETAADALKQEALKAHAELARMQQTLGGDGNDVSVLVASIEQLKARQEEAERTASAAFDRYWMAQHGNGKDTGSAYA
jgi:phage shock protein A